MFQKFCHAEIIISITKKDKILEIICEVSKLALKEDSVIQCKVFNKTSDDITMQLLLQGNVTNQKTALKYHDVSENFLQKVDDHKHKIQTINIRKKSQEAAKK